MRTLLTAAALLLFCLIVVLFTAFQVPDIIRVAIAVVIVALVIGGLRMFSARRAAEK